MATAALLPAALPWAPPVYNDGIIYAVRALAEGKANDGQQKMAWEYLMYLTGCGDSYADLSFRPDDLGGERATAFAEGKRFVGLMMRKMFRSELTPKGSQAGPAKEETPAQRRARKVEASATKAKTSRKPRTRI